MSKEKKKIDIKEKLTKGFFFTILLVASGIVGAMCGIASERSTSSQGSILEILLIFAVFMIAFIVQIILHEAGHLICGLISGYDFVSFRVGSLTLVKQDDKFAIKKFNIKGTAGQCLMFPKADNYEKCPYILYNLGGIIMNAIIAILCFVIYMIVGGNRYVDGILIAMIASGILSFITNGIPMKIGGISNDGYNVISIMKHKLIRYCFYIQLKVNGLSSKGIRVKDMPLKWFEIDAKSDFSNPLVTCIKCVEANYYHDKLEFDKAKQCYEFLLNYNPKIVKLYEYEIKCELLFYEIIGKRNEEKINELYTKKLKSYIKASKCHIPKLRLMYAHALIIENDIKKVEKILNEFEKAKKKYPNKGEIESELEIIEFIKNNFDRTSAVR
jgi:tetratricopeptide (TPR) repeat protein